MTFLMPVKLNTLENPSEAVRRPTLVIVTGLAGAGKSLVIASLEDLGFYCVDNLPAALLAPFAEAIINQKIASSKLALALDSRDQSNPQELSRLLPIFQTICDVEVVYLEADLEILVKRFRETRRIHPLSIAPDSRTSHYTVVEAIQLDGQILSQLRTAATKVINTSHMSSEDMRKFVRHEYTTHSQKPELRLNIISFGFKYGVPFDLDSVFDVRCFANPHYVEDLRPLTGLETTVSEFVFSDPHVSMFVNKVTDLLNFLYPLYQLEGKSYFGVGIGCTGGKHRSVAIAEKIAAALKNTIPAVAIEHRHMKKDHTKLP